MFVFFLLLFSNVFSLDNGLGLTPPLGWNSWNAFGCNINETVLKKQVDLIAKEFAPFGYRYVNLDDCWMDTTRNSNGELRADPKLFPSGMKSLGDYIHSKNLKFGIYLSAGTKTCSKKSKNKTATGWGSFGKEKIDAATIASFGADYLKYDGVCDVPAPPHGVSAMRWQQEIVTRMGVALNETNRPIYYQYGSPYVWQGRYVPFVAEKLAKNGGLNGWRSSFDMSDSWVMVQQQIDGPWGALQWARNGLAGPQHWPDFDDLEIGNGNFNPKTKQGLTFSQSQTYFQWWAIANAPLLLGTDLTKLSLELKKLVTNEEIIAVNQDFVDQVGVQVSSMMSNNNVWAKKLSGNRIVALLRGTVSPSQSVTVFWSDLGVPLHKKFHLRDITNRKDIGIYHTFFSASLNVDESVMIVFTPYV